MPTPITPVRLNPDLKDRAAFRAAAEGRDLSAVIREFLEEYARDVVIGEHPPKG